MKPLFSSRHKFVLFMNLTLILHRIIMDDTIGYFSRSNEILDEFIGLMRKAEAEKSRKPEVDKEKALDDFESFEKAVKASPKMRKVFIVLQRKFAEDPEYAKKVDPSFVAGVMLLDLPSDDQE